MSSIFWLFIYVLQSCIVYRLARFAYNLSRLAYIYWLAPRLGVGFKFHLYHDKWTVITGPTDGIGKEYLRQLARKGLRKFFLISRDEPYPKCQIRIRAFTFGRDAYSKLREDLEHLDIGILVNNAGTGPALLHRFAEDPETDRMAYKVNTESIFEMMQMVLPKMSKAKCGAIVNVSSVQSIRPMKLLAAYSTSKTFVSYLTECVHREYKADGITVQCLIPVAVDTKLMNYQNDDISSFDKLILTTPRKYAEEAINTLGVTSYTTGCWLQEVQYCIIYLFPWWIVRLTSEPYYRSHQKRLQRNHKKRISQLNTT